MPAAISGRDVDAETCQLPSMEEMFPQGMHWVLDPIDGTRGFVGLRQYAVCLGLLDQGQVPLSTPSPHALNSLPSFPPPSPPPFSPFLSPGPLPLIQVLVNHCIQVD